MIVLPSFYAQVILQNRAYSDVKEKYSLNALANVSHRSH